MTSDASGAAETPAEPPVSRGVIAARKEIREAEAARVLGLLEAEGLPEQASQWLVDGVATPNIRALAGLVGVPVEDVPDGVRSALVAEIAHDLSITFASSAEARSIHSEHIVRSMSQGAQMSASIYGLSNGFTDEWSGRVRGFFARLFRREP
jgi:hypothetical protein